VALSKKKKSFFDRTKRKIHPQKELDAVTKHVDADPYRESKKKIERKEWIYIGWENRNLNIHTQLEM